MADADAILERARTGTRLMTLRGAIMRVISVGANLLLVVLVTPSELGLLAVVRGTFVLLQYLAELGIGKAMLRRSRVPEPHEFAALAGVQLIVTTLVLGVGALWPAPILGFGAIDARWHTFMLGTVATMAFIALGTGARVRLERTLSYERLAKVDIFNVLLVNVGLVIAALLHQFSVGVFVVLGLATTATNGLLYLASPGPRPSLRLKPLAGVARDASGFLFASTFAVLREQGTPVLIGGLFGLPIAGLYSFAERIAQVLNVAFDGFRNASIPAAARLSTDVHRLRALSTRTLVGSASLTAPLAIMAICTLPILAQFAPRWTPAVLLAQWYIAIYAINGVSIAALEPSALSRHGSRAAIGQQFAGLAAGWMAFAALALIGSDWLALAVAAMYTAPVLALWKVSTPDIRPERSEELTQVLFGFAGGLIGYVTLRATTAPLLITTLIPVLIAIGFVPRLRRLPSQVLTRLRAHLRARRTIV